MSPNISVDVADLPMGAENNPQSPSLLSPFSEAHSSTEEAQNSTEEARNNTEEAQNGTEGAQNSAGEVPAESNPTFEQSIVVILTHSWYNLLLAFIPISFYLRFFMADEDVTIFITCMLATIPISRLLSLGSDEIAKRVGDTPGELIQTTLENTFEMIVAIISLLKCDLVIVKSTLLGAILLGRIENSISVTAAQVQSSILIMSLVAILIPTGFKTSSQSSINTDADVLSVSRGISVILFVIYAAYLLFQLGSHAHHFNPTSNNSPDESEGHESWDIRKRPQEFLKRILGKTLLMRQRPSGGMIAPRREGKEVLLLNAASTTMLLLLCTFLTGVITELLVGRIAKLRQFGSSGGASEAWFALILLPIVGNAGSLLYLLQNSANSDQRKRLPAMTGAISSSIQIGLFIVPLVVILGWMLAKPLTLIFDSFQSMILFLSVLVVNSMSDTRWSIELVRRVYAIVCLFHEFFNHLNG
ncbi:hypothetical protein PCASD_05990 [Puccinia coronata f. sp. avenae]|uniref:Sodium/calcium exchanger membrane region domain-containing protein n=2 Tax=Puccinia coronata f. sp. avenae TaxID=200324 RepID=A0A2N5V9Y7_9BASI|nr:hypothetical protein PCASD_05990 [Puccinia coronata f. sp. avenae]